MSKIVGVFLATLMFLGIMSGIAIAQTPNSEPSGTPNGSGDVPTGTLAPEPTPVPPSPGDDGVSDDESSDDVSDDDHDDKKETKEKRGKGKGHGKGKHKKPHWWFSMFWLNGGW